jgi:DTW domain-containing protein YfiP
MYAIAEPALQAKDRELVHKRMQEHVCDPDTTPLLVFPEGTCVNNEYTVMFKKGAFDLGATVCPVAIKYNKIFVDAFWNSRRQAFSTYIVCTRARPRCRACVARVFRLAARVLQKAGCL